jgi:nitroreductase
LKEMGISRSDLDGLSNWRRRMSQFFDAPNAVILHLDSSLSQWSLLDAGLALQNLMLAACQYGVGTCPLAAGVSYPDLIRSLLGIPESHRIVLGVALGYPDLSSPAARFRASREPMDRMVTWHGFVRATSYSHDSPRA